MDNWVFVKAIEDLAVWLLLFTLVTACATRWRSRKLSIGVPVGFALVVLGAYVAASVFFVHITFADAIDFRGWAGLTAAMVLILLIGFIWISRSGRRRSGDETRPAAAGWPRMRITLVFAVALILNVVTHWNLKVAMLQRLNHATLEAHVMALSIMPGRPLESENAAVLYEPVLKRLRDLKIDGEPIGWNDYEDPSVPRYPKLVELAEKHRADLQILIRATHRPHCHFGPRPIGEVIDIKGTHFEWLGPMQNAAILLTEDTRTKIAAGELEAAAENTAALFRMARHVNQTDATISLLVSVAFDRMGAGLLQELLNQPGLTADHLSQLRPETGMDFRRNLKHAWIMEETGTMDIARRIAVRRNNRLDDWLFRQCLPYFLERELDFMQSTYREARSAIDLPWSESSNRIESLNNRYLRQRGVLSGVSPLPRVVTLVAPKAMIGDAQLRLARLAVAMKQYEMKHGGWPDSFDALAPEYLEDLPLDPSTDEPFQMEQVEEGLRIYSAAIEAMEHPPGYQRQPATVEMFLKSRQ
jgi:hypothetical protein